MVRGTSQLPPCSGCGEPVQEVLLCRTGHIVCPACSESCVHCHQVSCRTCGIFTCSLCHRFVCADCAEECSGCGKSVCAKHVLSSEDTDRRVCPRCAVDCPHCRKRFQETPLQRCALGEEQVCAACLSPCAICEKPVCAEHVFECATCGRNVCVEEEATCPGCGQPYCGECMEVGEQCPTCRSLFRVNQAGDAIVSLLASAGVSTARSEEWHLAENRRHFLVEGRWWWRRRLFVIDKATMAIVARRRFFRWR